MEEIILPREFMRRILSHGRSAYPDEACGILAGEENVVKVMYEATNLESSPVSYMLDPGEQFRIMKEIRDRGMRMVAIYHSHPLAPPYPSQKDINLVFYHDAAYIIAGLLDRADPQVKAFEIIDGQVREIGIKELD
ncbi:Mov34/MPN/PAD-1 family [Candidatus Sulfobium mesophilum]|uniref:Mov34/MPN/PAD-1 family n=1 Tax=Candidatus Sulfobium mesophilum TaxID=2016548 RepID=A0A2U3QIE0_9BACT|nr:Mov34/MPN/PAD-1 family [Candidatus Sulfobium mesophilum]